MGRLSVSLDAELLAEVQRLAGVRTKREALEIALRDFVRQQHLRELQTLAGSGLVEMSLKELQRWRKAATPEG